MAGFRRLYGAGPFHLLAHLGVFVVAAWAINQILGGGSVINWIVWFIGAALLHDLVLVPAYSLLDRGLSVTGTRPGPRRPPGRQAIVNHLRAPALISGVLLLVYFPLILGLSEHNYHADTGYRLAGYTRNWLLITAGLFLASAIVYAIRRAFRRDVRRKPRRPPAPPRTPRPPAPPA